MEEFVEFDNACKEAEEGDPTKKDDAIFMA